MKAVNKYSRLTALFTISWKDLSGISHQDGWWTNQVNLWRDYFPDELTMALIDKTEGEKVDIILKPDAFFAPFSEQKHVRIKKNNFRDPHSNQIVLPTPGRYYPQGFLYGVSGIFRASTAPALCLGTEKDTVLFDLNHPLAGHELDLSIVIEAIHHDTAERGGRCEDWLELICADGPGMQARRQIEAADYFTTDSMQRIDMSPDTNFYKKPRMVHHLDSTAREIIRNKCNNLLTPNGRILDLMASWDSHLPEDLLYQTLTVLGLNEEELCANKKATDRIVQDLNKTLSLPFADNSIDTVLCTASVEYLTAPQAIFAEIQRILKHGGIAVVAFSNRWFAPKAIKLWSILHEFERLGMVLELFRKNPGFHNTASMSLRGKPRPPDDPHQDYIFSDPVYMAWSYKQG